jgi:prophage DNA circulation protein
MKITDNHNPWRDALRPASFRGARFHVEVSSETSGRRTALHVFPKKDKPYAEDMGRRPREIGITAYLIGPDYLDARDELMDMLEVEGPGTLSHPTRGDFRVICVRHSLEERRTMGGYCEVHMTFVEAGEKPNNLIGLSTSADVNTKADGATGAASSRLDEAVNT